MFDQTICTVIGTCLRLAWTRLLTGHPEVNARKQTFNDAGQKSSSGKLNPTGIQLVRDICHRCPRPSRPTQHQAPIGFPTFGTSSGQLSERKSGRLLPKRHQIKHLEFVISWFGTRGSEVQILSPRPSIPKQFIELASIPNFGFPQFGSVWVQLADLPPSAPLPLPLQATNANRSLG